MTLSAAQVMGPIAAFWALALLGALKEKRDNPYRLGPEAAGPAGDPRVAVIIPARDEAANIGPCLESVLAQDWPLLDIFVLDDGSTDGTGAILAGLAAAHPGKLHVLSGGGAPLPAGWFGKPWACQRAAQAALATSPDALLFLDADVRLTAPSAIRAALGERERQGVGLLSGLGALEVITFWERVLQPVIAGLVVSGASMKKHNDPQRRKGKPLANGQFLLFSRAAYEAIGGHEAVQNSVVDDVSLATAIRDGGHGYRLVYMRTLFKCRMYNSFGEIWRGWSKNLFIGIEKRWDRLAFVVAFLFWTSLLPILTLILTGAGLLAPAWGAWSLGTLALLHTFRFVMDRLFGNDPRYGLLHSLGNAIAIGIFLNSAWQTTRGRATWKGRTLA